MKVEVESLRGNSGTPVAAVINVKSGTIASFSTTSLTLTTSRGSVTFKLNDQTIVKDGPLEVGEHAEVKATLNADGSYTARVIEMED